MGISEKKDNLKNFFDPKIYRLLNEDPSKRALRAEERLITILQIAFYLAEVNTESLDEFGPLYSDTVDFLLDAGATIDGLHGTRIIAYYNYPEVREDHALTACETSWNLIRFAKEKYPDIPVGVGVHTGETILGNLGSDQMMTHTLIGDHVVLAEETLFGGVGDDSEVIVSQFTHDHVAEVFDLSEVNWISFGDQRIKLYEILRRFHTEIPKRSSGFSSP